MGWVSAKEPAPHTSRLERLTREWGPYGAKTTWEDLAEALGVSRPTVWRWRFTLPRHRKLVVSLLRLARSEAVAEHLAMWLATGEGEMPQPEHPADPERPGPGGGAAPALRADAPRDVTVSGHLASVVDLAHERARRLLARAPRDSDGHDLLVAAVDRALAILSEVAASSSSAA